MSHLESLTIKTPSRSHRVAKAPGGVRLEWDAEIINEKPDELITWRPVGPADLNQGGSVRFERVPGGRATRVRVSLQYDPPAGDVGHVFAALLGEDAGRKIGDDLENLKQAMEAGAGMGTGF